jgi:hypothetical protein
MLPYSEALKVWASRRFEIPAEDITSVEMTEVEATPATQIGDYTWVGGEEAHMNVVVYTVDPGRFRNEAVRQPMTELMYEVYAAGMEG